MIKETSFSINHFPLGHYEKTLVPLQSEITHIFAENLEKFIQLLKKYPHLTKIFAKQFCRENKQCRDLTAIFNALWNSEGTDFPKLLVQTETAILESKMIIQKNYPHLASLPIDYLQVCFHKNHRKIRSTLRLVEELEVAKKNQSDLIADRIEDIQIQLKVFCLHYLVKAAKIPLLDSSKFNHVPFSEYRVDNAPLYYRGDGGPIITLYIEALINKYPCLKECKIGLIKNGQFTAIISKYCKETQENELNLKQSEGFVLKDYDDEALEELLNTLEADVCYFLDITTVLSMHTNEPQAAIFAIKKIFNNKKPLNIVYGGVLKVERQDIYLFFPGNENPLTQRFINGFKQFQSSNGAYPEIVTIKYRLIDLNFDEQKFYPPSMKLPWITPKNSLNVEIQFDEIKEAFAKLMDTKREILRKSDCFLECTQFHLNLVASMLENIFLDKLSRYCPDYRLLLKPIKRIEKYLISIKTIEESEKNPLNKFPRILEEFSLLIEEIIYLMIFQRGKEDKRDEIKCALAKLPQLPSNKIEKRNFIFTSGMSCFGYITDALIDSFETKTMIEALFHKKSYYELFDEKGGLKDYMSSHYNCEKKSRSELEKSSELHKYDVMFADLYPNRVVFDTSTKTKIKELLISALDQRKKQDAKELTKPLVAVIDTATTLFYHNEIEELLKDLASELEEGKLVLIVVNSLAKFIMSGLDKYTGGLVQVYGGDSHFMKILGDKLQELVDKDPFSREAKDFFHLLFTKCSANILQYLEAIRQNTDEVYKLLSDKELLKEKHKKAPIQIAKKGDHIPMIGLHFDYLTSQLGASCESPSEDEIAIMTLLMQYYLFAKCMMKNLPINIRSSFAHSSSSFIECWTALRLTIGLEKEFLEIYVKVILEANHEISELLNIKNNAMQEKFKTISNMGYDKLKVTILNDQFSIIQSGKEGFKHFLTHLSKLPK